MTSFLHSRTIKTAFHSSADQADAPVLPGAHLDVARMPGHWLLARLGKRVLRPGGRQLTSAMLATLRVTKADRVVELAPGLGLTARQVLRTPPASYVGVERDPEAASLLAGQIACQPGARIVEGDAEATSLDTGSADAVLGEAMLTMQTEAGKRAIVAEAWRLLAPGGRYAIHELALTPDDLDSAQRQRITQDLVQAIHVGARPLDIHQWRDLLEAQGFRVETVHRAPMRLLAVSRFLIDEGPMRSLRFLARLLRDRAARRRVLQMRRVFRRHARHLQAVALIARKPAR